MGTPPEAALDPERTLCSACRRPVPIPPPLLCDCGVALTPVAQETLASRRLASDLAARWPHPAWALSWLLSLPFQVFTVLAAVDPPSRELLFNIHELHGLLFVFSTLFAIAQPAFMVAWLLRARPDHPGLSPRRVAFVLAALCTFILVGGGVLGVFS